MCIAQMYFDGLETPSSDHLASPLNQVKQNDIIEEHAIIRNAFGCITQNANSGHGQDSRNRPFFNTGCLLISFSSLISRCGSHYFMGIVEKES
jgi:hypothetical protein